jgi:hypothetical protein
VQAARRRAWARRRCRVLPSTSWSVQEKLRLDIDDEAAVEWMQQLLQESATALMPQIMETTHKWAQYWR